MPVYRVPVKITANVLPDPAYNIWHLRTSGAPDDPGPGISALHDWYTALISYMSTGTTITFPADLVNVEDQTDYQLGNQPANITGGSTTAAERGLAYMVRWKTSVRARRGMGRTFLGPVGQNAVNGSGWPMDAFVTAVRNATTTLLNASADNTNGWALGVWGQQNKGQTTPKVLRDFTGFTLGDYWGHLRSRVR